VDQLTRSLFVVIYLTPLCTPPFLLGDYDSESEPAQDSRTLSEVTLPVRQQQTSRGSMHGESDFNGLGAGASSARSVSVPVCGVSL
jgi:hypothetical protein